jgi:hypothetical protein
VSPNQAGVNLRANPSPALTCIIGQRTNPRVGFIPEGYRGWTVSVSSLKVVVGNLNYPTTVRDSAKSGWGCKGNRHLNYLVESILVNVGDPRQDAIGSCFSLQEPIK